jgi:hypothetical protein
MTDSGPLFEQRALSFKAANGDRSPASHGASPSHSADRRKYPPDCADGRCISIEALAVQIWVFCAFAGWRRGRGRGSKQAAAGCGHLSLLSFRCDPAAPPRDQLRAADRAAAINSMEATGPVRRGGVAGHV